MNKGAIAAVGLILVSGGLLAVKAINTKDTTDKIDLTIEEVKAKLNGLNLVSTVKINFLNPSANALTITHPFVKAFLDGRQIATTNPQNLSYTIGERSSKAVSIELQSSLLNLGLSVLEYGQNILQYGKLNKTVTLQIITSVNGLNVTQIKEILL